MRNDSLYLRRILLVAIRARHQMLLSKTREGLVERRHLDKRQARFRPGGSARTWRGVRELLCRNSRNEVRSVREQLAFRLINWAALGTVDGTQLYIRAL